MLEKPNTFIGTVVKVYQANDDNFFSAALLHDDTLGWDIRVRGSVLLSAGARIRAWGYWVSDPRFGEQFEIVDFDYISKPFWAV